jgi:hypothetical protein
VKHAFYLPESRRLANSALAESSLRVLDASASLRHALSDLAHNAVAAMACCIRRQLAQLARPL